MSAVIIDMATYRRLDQTIAEQVANRLRGYAPCVVRYAQAFAESYQRKTGCRDVEAIGAGVRCANSRPEPEPPRAA